MSNLKEIRALVKRGIRGGLLAGQHLGADEVHHLCERLSKHFEEQSKILQSCKNHVEVIMNEGMDEQEVLELHAELTTLLEGA